MVVADEGRGGAMWAKIFIPATHESKRKRAAAHRNTAFNTSGRDTLKACLLPRSAGMSERGRQRNRPFVGFESTPAAVELFFVPLCEPPLLNRPCYEYEGVVPTIHRFLILIPSKDPRSFSQTNSPPQHQSLTAHRHTRASLYISVSLSGRPETRFSPYHACPLLPRERNGFIFTADLPP